MRVHRQVADFERSCARRELDETHPTKRSVAASRMPSHREEALTGYSEDNVEAMDSLERATNDLVAAASTLYAIDPALFQAKMGVSLLAAVRGLDSGGPSALPRRPEGGRRGSPGARGVAQGKEGGGLRGRQRRSTRRPNSRREGASDAARHADPMASRLSATGRGLQDTAANDAVDAGAAGWESGS